MGQEALLAADDGRSTQRHQQTSPCMTWLPVMEEITPLGEEQ